MKVLSVDYVARLLVQNCRFSATNIECFVYVNGKKVAAKDADQLVLRVKKELLKTGAILEVEDG